MAWIMLYIRHTLKDFVLIFNFTSFYSPTQHTLFHNTAWGFTDMEVIIQGRHSLHDCCLKTDRCYSMWEKSAIHWGFSREDVNSWASSETHNWKIKAQAEETCGQRCEAAHEMLIWICGAMLGQEGGWGGGWMMRWVETPLSGSQRVPQCEALNSRLSSV